MQGFKKHGLLWSTGRGLETWVTGIPGEVVHMCKSVGIYRYRALLPTLAIPP